MNHQKLLVNFKADCELRGMAAVSCTTYTNQAKSYLKFLDELGTRPEEADKVALKAYLNHLRKRGIKQSSIERIFAVLASFYDYLEEEDLIESNPVRPMRKRYLRAYKATDESQMRRAISVEEAATLVESILSSRDRAIVLTLLKTGIRKGELISLDVDDLDFVEQTIRLKPTAKRSNRLVFFDPEAGEALSRWLKARKTRKGADSPALFLSQQGARLDPGVVQTMVKKHAERVGLHDPTSERLEDRFTPHCCRHWFTTHLIRANMSRDYVKELRGDVRKEAIDIYNHIDREDLRRSYLVCIPQLGV